MLRCNEKKANELLKELSQGEGIRRLCRAGTNPKFFGADVKSRFNLKKTNMRKLMPSNARATVCTKDTCVTLFGPAAQVVTLVTVLTVIVLAVSLTGRVAD
jgi:hypothetical protein